MTCTFCGEPATSACKKLHLEWIIVLPLQIKSKDVLRGVDGLLYQVLKLKRSKRDDNAVQVVTGQRKTLVIAFLELPVLVKRYVVCGWPRCEFHCGKCMRYSEAEARREALLNPERKPQRAHAGKRQTVTEPREKRQHKSKT